MRWLRVLERVLIGVGLVLLIGVVMVRTYGVLRARADVRRLEQSFAAPEASPTPAPDSAGLDLPSALPVDTSLWAKGRIEAYEESLQVDPGQPLAVLRIPKIDLAVPVLEGTDDFVLNRAVGRILGTASVDAMGNLGIAGHRDGFFRGLKDVVAGDSIELVAPRGTRIFEIDEILIVNPEDVHVLGPTELPTITLVTCYPFYYVGKAPRRYIVRASERGATP